MKAFTICGASVLAALTTLACGDSGLSAADLNKNPPPATGATSGQSGGSAGTAAGGAAGSGSPVGGAAGSSTTPGGGSAGTSTAGTGPTAGTGSGGGTGGTGEPPGPYADRSGTFKMLVLTRTAAFAHTGSIATGKAMLQEIEAEQGFDIQFAESKEEVDQVMAAGLDQFEIIFHMNTTGDIFTPEQQEIYKTWMENDGAFAGVHAATDTENGWDFYSEVTGQYYNGHGNAGVHDQIQFDPAMLDFPALKGLPNPWQRNEEWYKFDSYQQWSVKPGFKVLGRKAADSQPIVWAREWGNFRAFYTAIGHDASVFQDPLVKKHVTGGIMWAVRRDKLIK